MIEINGRRFSGNNITIINGKVIVDGNDVTPEEKEINISVAGNIESLSADACSQINIGGSAGSVKTMSGSISCGNVSGSVGSMSGNIQCGNVSGSVSTMSGNIRNQQ